MKGKHLLGLLVVLLLDGTDRLTARGEEADQSTATMVTVTPETTDEILANPDMGWETFHHSNRHDRNLPSWIPSTVYYIRWGWVELEPRPGEIDHELLGRVLNDCRESGQKLAFRVMCCSTTRNEPYQPGWLKQVGGKELVADYDGADFPIADFDDPTTLERHIDFIRRLGKRYDGHPDISHVDIGSIGWWGEWHLSGSRKSKMPGLENQIKVIDAYLAAFKKTPLLMLIGGGPALKHATEHGAGWRRRLPRRHGRVFQDVVPHARQLSGLDQGKLHPGRVENRTRRLGDLLGHPKVGQRRLVAAIHFQLRSGPSRLVHQQQVVAAAST